MKSWEQIFLLEVLHMCLHLHSNPALCQCGREMQDHKQHPLLGVPPPLPLPSPPATIIPAAASGSVPMAGSPSAPVCVGENRDF